MSRRLVVNADDFGFTRDVNEGIVASHCSGIVRSTSLMANGGAFDHAVQLARDNPSLDVGCHLVLTGGSSVLIPGAALPRSLGELLASILTRRLRPFDEMCAQLEKALSAGVRVTHLDTHKGVHLLPPVMEAIARVSERYRVAWVRFPFDLGWQSKRAPLKRAWVYGAMRLLRGRLLRTLRSHGCRTTDHFTGLNMIGMFGVPDLVRLFRCLPAGTTELMCHPGYCGAELLVSETHLTRGRERELAALMAAETRVAAAENQIEFVSYRELQDCSGEACPREVSS